MSFFLRCWLLGWFVFAGQGAWLPSIHAGQDVTATPVVHAVLFWMEGCPNCEVVLSQFLPEVQSRFGDRLEVQLVEVVSTQDVDRLYEVGKSFGLEKEQVGVPLMIVGNRVLIGSNQIPGEFPGLVDQYLASGGVEAPDLDHLSLQSVSADSPVEEAPKSSGMALAAAIAVGMILTLGFAAWKIYQAFDESAMVAPSWLDLAIPVLSLVGLGIALYMTFVEATSARAICGPIGDCNAVQKSSYARAFGIIPVGLIGVAGYIAMLAVWLWGRFRSDHLSDYAPVALWGMAVFGTIYSMYLTYLELFVIKAVCIWCLSSAVVITFIMLASLPGCTRWLADSAEE